MTGNDIIDKKLKSAYKTSLTKQTNDVIALYQDGQITLDQAKTLIGNISAKSASTKKSKKISIKFPKVKAIKITKLAKIKNFKITTPKISSKKLSSNVVKTIKPIKIKKSKLKFKV